MINVEPVDYEFHWFIRTEEAATQVECELAAKGIDRDTAEQALENFSIDEQSAITELLNEKFSRDLGDDRGIRRTIATLQRYGYEMGDIMCALREYASSLEDN